MQLKKQAQELNYSCVCFFYIFLSKIELDFAFFNSNFVKELDDKFSSFSVKRQYIRGPYPL